MKSLLPFLVAASLSLLDPQTQGSGGGCAFAPEFSFYEVQGTSLPDIYASLRERGPRDERGVVRFAFTDWTVEWNWGTTSARKVELDSLRVRCSATIKLPKLMITRDTPLAVIRSWNDFLERTRAHEMKHVENVTRGAARIRSRLEAAEASRGKLSPKQANAAVSLVIEEIREFDRVYDRRTNHGHTEGTWDLE